MASLVEVVGGPRQKELFDNLRKKTELLEPKFDEALVTLASAQWMELVRTLETKQKVVVND